MSNKISDGGTFQDRWARFRFSVVGPLLSSPPENGTLRESLIALSKKQWNSCCFYVMVSIFTLINRQILLQIVFCEFVVL